MYVMTEREQIAHPKCGYFLLTGTGVREGRSRRAYHGAPKGALCGYGFPAHLASGLPLDSVRQVISGAG